MGTQNMPRAIGVRRAKELILSAQPFSAADALAWGLANRVLPAADLMREAMRPRPASPPMRRSRCDRQSDRSTRRPTSTAPNGYSFEIEAYNRTVGTEDRLEGISSFSEKRKPEFKGR